MHPTPSQLDRLTRLIDTSAPSNRFLADKVAGWNGEFCRLPFTTKAELAADQLAHPPYGSNLTYQQSEYVRLHQTSGTTTGTPLRWWDTPESWAVFLANWRIQFDWMGITAADRLAFPFSFGPFIGFWAAFEAAAGCGIGVLPCGGMSTVARLRWLTEHRATVVFTTPTYALHLADTAAAEGIDLQASAVRAVVVAGEPGGSIPATRERIATGWGARVFDHYGLTEVGPSANETVQASGTLKVLEEQFIAEVIDPLGVTPTSHGEVGELVLTTLGRAGSPAIRYRTGDLVRAERRADGLYLVGGVLGRADDMLHVRGNNIYPSAVEAIVRRFNWVGEFRLVADRTGPLIDLRLEIESAQDAPPDACDQLARAIKAGLLLRVPVTAVPHGTLPRSEFKSRRLVKVG